MILIFHVAGKLSMNDLRPVVMSRDLQHVGTWAEDFPQRARHISL